MKIFVGQIYIKPGISFPLSLQFQKWLGEELSRRVEASEYFRKTYSSDFDLGLRISAKSDISQPEIKGPTVFKHDKNVEFTIFLPHGSLGDCNKDGYRRLVRMILHSVLKVLQELKIDTTKVRDSTSALIEHFIATPAMIESPER